MVGRGGLDEDGENASFKNGATIKGTIKRAINIYDNLGLRDFDERTWHLLEQNRKTWNEVVHALKIAYPALDPPLRQRSEDERMQMPTPGNVKYGTTESRLADGQERRYPIGNCGATKTSRATMTKHILEAHPLIRTKWRCTCGDEGFESRLIVMIHVKRCFENGQVRSRPRYRTQWAQSTSTGELHSTDQEAEYLAREGDLAMCAKEDMFKAQVIQARKLRIKTTDKEALLLLLPHGQHGPQQVEYVLTAFTDGATAANGTPRSISGVGVYYEDGHSQHIAGPLEGPVQTNNRAELKAGELAIEEMVKMAPTLTYTPEI